MPKKRQMDAIKLLKQDHDRLRALFEELEGASGRATSKKQKLFDQIRETLETHMAIEEEIFYPTVRGFRAKETRERVAESVEEHALAKILLKQLAESTTDSDAFKPKLKVLSDIVLHHIKDEERVIFAEAKSHLSKGKLGSLGEELEMRKEAMRQILEAEPEPAAEPSEEAYAETEARAAG